MNVQTQQLEITDGEGLSEGKIEKYASSFFNLLEDGVMSYSEATSFCSTHNLGRPAEGDPVIEMSNVIERGLKNGIIDIKTLEEFMQTFELPARIQGDISDGLYSANEFLSCVFSEEDSQTEQVADRVKKCLQNGERSHKYIEKLISPRPEIFMNGHHAAQYPRATFVLDELVSIEGEIDEDSPFWIISVGEDVKIHSNPRKKFIILAISETRKDCIQLLGRDKQTLWVKPEELKEICPI